MAARPAGSPPDSDKAKNHETISDYRRTGHSLTAKAQAAQSPAHPPTGQILQYGVYTLLSGGEVVKSKKSSTGKSVSKPVITRDRQTDRIPLIKDKYMAYQYRLSNLPDLRRIKLRRVLIHPPMNLPDGKVSTGSDYTVTRKVERNEVFAFDAYALNKDYEMVVGDWIFQIWYQNRMLLE